MADINDKEMKPKAAEPARYGKEKFLASKQFTGKTDLLAALLDDDKTYTTDQVITLIGDFLKKEVK